MKEDTKLFTNCHVSWDTLAEKTWFHHLHCENLSVSTVGTSFQIYEAST